MSEWEQRLAAWADELAADADDADWVTLPEAEEEVGVARSTLRNWYRTGQIPSRMLDGPHGPQRLVRLDAVLARAAQSPKLTRRAEREVALEAQVVLLRARVDSLEARLRRVEAQY